LRGFSLSRGTAAKNGFAISRHSLFMLKLNLW